MYVDDLLDYLKVQISKTSIELSTCEDDNRIRVLCTKIQHLRFCYDSALDLKIEFHDILFLKTSKDVL